MPQPKKPARVLKWRDEWYLMFTDHLTGKARRLSCAMLGAANAEQRKELEREFRSRELTDSAEVLQRGGRLAYGASLVGSLDEYLSDLARRAKARQQNPEARSGVSASTAVLMRDSVERFKSWLEHKQLTSLTTGDLDAPTLQRYFDFLASERGRRGKSKVKRSASTINHHKRNVRACLGFINSLRPRRFPDFDDLKAALKPHRTSVVHGGAFTPAELAAFLKAALNRDDPKRVVLMKRKKPKGPEERFGQKAPRVPETSVARLFLLLALTGMRLGEALQLKWEDVDFERGRIVVRAQKTGMVRVLPLVGAPEGEIAPTFRELLKSWREDNSGEFVLPHGSLDKPVFPKGAWEAAHRESKARRVSPQGLRRNFTSYAASMGIPATVAALWQGHSAAVAERHYRTQVLERHGGDSLEAAMGLDGEITRCFGVECR
ncbi:MAG: hypothetical protein DPW14_10775 [Planctomycetes bacterium]|nr:hypothetical protein [Planctomycetota bacterium]